MGRVPELPVGDRKLALVKGGGDLASGVALRLVRAGYSVVITETPRPTVVRRTVAFAEAVYEGRVQVAGIEAALAAHEQEIWELLSRDIVPVVVDPRADIRHRLCPDLLVDAIMAKQNLGTCITDAPAVVALGPGFFAGRDVHAVIETMRGPALGRVIMQGEALPDTGIPAERNGSGKERILRSPGDGLFVPLKQIGDQVGRREVVGMVGDLPVISKLDGILRGILREGLWVDAGFKLGDVDPGAQRGDCYLVSDKALAIGSGVVEAAGRLVGAGVDSRGGNTRTVKV